MKTRYKHYRNCKLYDILHDDVIDVDSSERLTIYTDGKLVFARSQKDFWGFTNSWERLKHRLGLGIGQKRFTPVTEMTDKELEIYEKLHEVVE